MYTNSRSQTIRVSLNSQAYEQKNEGCLNRKNTDLLQEEYNYSMKECRNLQSILTSFQHPVCNKGGIRITDRQFQQIGKGYFSVEDGFYFSYRNNITAMNSFKIFFG